MHDGYPRRHAVSHNQRPRTSRTALRPDRVALWAVIMAVVAMVAAAASSAEGSSGGISDDPSAEARECDNARLGQRKLSLGDCGKDVKTLNWILNSKPYSKAAPMNKKFKGRTDRAVTRFQRKKDLKDHGVADRRTTRKLVRTMRKDGATWYGGPLLGNNTACGQKLTRRTVGVAHKTLPCGTKVTFRYKGRFLRTRVIDRGPYVDGVKWDLTQRAAKKLRFKDAGRDNVRAAIVR